MSPDIYVESRHIGYAILWGFKLAIFYDVFLIFRNVIKHKNFFIYAEDFIYWILCAVFVFEHIYEIGNGYIRWYMALGVGIGMLAYKLTISKWLVKGVSFVLNKMKELIAKSLRIFFGPFYRLGRKMGRLFKYIGARAMTFFRLLKKKLTLTLKMLKIAISKH